MKIEITTLNYQASDKLKDIVTKKVMRLERYFDEDISAKVLMKREKDSEKLELTIFLKGSVLRAETVGDNMYNNIDDVLPKIERQIHKHKTRLQTRVKSFDDSMLFVQEKVEEREGRGSFAASAGINELPRPDDLIVPVAHLCGFPHL